MKEPTKEIVARSELLKDLTAAHRERLLAIAEERALDAGEYLFRLGDEATCAYVVVDGRIEFCFPLSLGGAMQDVAVESKEPGSALGWSAFVSPHSFTVSARAAEPSVVGSFPRAELMRLIEEDCHFALAFIGRIGEIVADRLLKIQALWARELQRSVTTGGIAGLGAQAAHRGTTPPKG